MRKTLKTFFLSFFVGFLGLVAGIAAATDWDLPNLTSHYADVIAYLKARDVSLSRMNYSSDSNVPTGAIRWNDSNGKFEKWSGASWGDLQTALTAHLANTSNPHATTAAQVGAPTLAAFSAHTGNTSNPHATTAAQVGALASANNLSDVASASTARSNIGAAASADLTSHTSNTSNPHNVTALQIGALRSAQNLSDVSSATTARSNLSAAKSGANSDITNLDALNSSGVKASSGVSLTLRGGGSGAHVDILAGNNVANRWRFEDGGKVNPPPALRFDYTVAGTYTTRRTLNPSGATAQQCADAVNTLWADLITQGVLQ